LGSWAWFQKNKAAVEYDDFDDDEYEDFEEDDIEEDLDDEYFVQRQLKRQLPTNPFPNAGRNAPCPCGSGKKYKVCCLKKQ